MQWKWRLGRWPATLNPQTQSLILLCRKMGVAELENLKSARNDNQRFGFCITLYFCVYNSRVSSRILLGAIMYVSFCLLGLVVVDDMYELHGCICNRLEHKCIERPDRPRLHSPGDWARGSRTRLFEHGLCIPVGHPYQICTCHGIFSFPQFSESKLPFFRS